MTQEENIPFIELGEQVEIHPISEDPRSRLGIIAAILAICLLVSTIALSLSSSKYEEILLLISLDGFRPDYLDRGLTPNILSLGQLRPPYMKPVFPTVTFTNHYTIATGLYPKYHGIVGNTFFDSSLNETFTYTSAKNNQDGRWWKGGEPIWITAVRQGVKSATMFWPGSEAKINGFSPTYFRKYDPRVTLEQKVDQILEWIDLPARKRPRLITLYIPQVDSTGHSSGPNSNDIDSILQSVDSAIGNLISGFKERDIFQKMNIIITSDHGMTKTEPFNKTIYLSDYIDLGDIEIIENGPLLSIFTENPKILSNLSESSSQGLFQVWGRDQIPSELFFDHPTRIAPITLLCKNGYMAVASRKDFDPRHPSYPTGVHGYYPNMTDMHAIFLAHGPAFPKSNFDTPIANVDVYSIAADILGIVPSPNNGSNPFKKAL